MISVSCLSTKTKRVLPLQLHVSFGKNETIWYDPEPKLPVLLKQKPMVQITSSSNNSTSVSKPLSPSEYATLGLNMTYFNPIDPFKNITKYAEYPDKIKYEIMIQSLQEEIFTTEWAAQFRIYEVLYHHLEQTDSNDPSFDPIRQWIINTGLEFGFDSLIEQYLRPLKVLQRIQKTSDHQCEICKKNLNPFFVEVIKSIPVVQSLVPDEYKGKTLLFKSHCIQKIMKSIDADAQYLGLDGSKTMIIKSMVECVMYGNCPCLLFEKIV